MKAERLIATIGLLVFAPLATREAQRDELVVWNVGQGLWVTLVTEEKCLHFDMGGETADWGTLLHLCGRHHENHAYFSHWDWDHIGMALPASRRLPKFCVAADPAGQATSSRKKAIFATLPHCAGAVPIFQEENPTKHAKRKQNSNAASRVYLLDNRAILPGDSPQASEKHWSARLPQAARARWLILGHHGSRTSTGQTLLNRLAPYLKQAIASARRRRYGHPHPQVVRRLKENGVSAMTTEDWGHVRLELPPTRLAGKMWVLYE